MILSGIVHVVSGFPLHFMFYRGNLDCFSNRVYKLSFSGNVQAAIHSINYSYNNTMPRHTKPAVHHTRNTLYSYLMYKDTARRRGKAALDGNAQ